MRDMEKSTLRTIKTILQKEKIGIFGDYDVDGATSTALLGNYFEIVCSFLVLILSYMLLKYQKQNELF